MQIKTTYTKRPIRFVELYEYAGWRIKLYSISSINEFVDSRFIEEAKSCLKNWLQNSINYNLDTYKIATLILHQCKEGCFAIINWWIDENMLQQFVYLTTNADSIEFKLYSDKGIITCVWEMAVLWFERNSWVEHVLSKAPYPDFEKYITQHYNNDI